MLRLVIALIVLGLCAPIVGESGTAEAQVWKVKKGKPGAKAATKASPKAKARPTRTARPTMKKKRATAQRVKLVPDEDEDEAVTRRPDSDQGDRADDDGPIFIQVEEID